MKVVGARIPRYDGVAHVTGRTTYVDDVNVPGTLWAKALRSPHPHAGITKLDTTKAESMPGVHAVITWKDVPLLEYGHLSALGIPGRRAAAREGRRALPRPADRSRRGGERGARVAAVDAIEIAFEERPALFDVREAFDADSPKIHHWGNWYPHFEGEMDRRQIRKGDIDWAFENADTIVQGVYRPLRSSTRPSRRRSARSSPSRTAG
jgi:CO/xanthine dehydrogenase Mo-binding subunit